MKKSLLYRLEVAPLLILPLGRSPYFSYVSAEVVPKGSLVFISFGKQNVEGIVFDCQVLPGPKPSWMKYISQVIETNFLTANQCALAVIISNEYFTPLGKTLKHFLPKRVHARKKTSEKVVRKKILRLQQEEKTFLNKLSLAPKKIPTYIDTSLYADAKKLLILIAREYVNKKEQILILVPEITLTITLSVRFQEIFAPETIAVLHSKLSAGNFYSAWEHIRSGEASIIIATRQGLFAPFQKLGAIIITEEQDESYKQWDMSPRYHGKRVADFLAKISQAHSILTSGTPSVESMFLIQKKLLFPMRSLSAHQPLGSALSLINLKLERYRKNFSPLSEALVQALRETLSAGGQALLFINRQGMNAFSLCESCKNVFRCPDCDHPLTNTREGNFRCPLCGYATALFPSCPACKHLTFRHVGFGTEKVEKEIKRLFPQARVARLDSTTVRKTNALETIFEKGLSGKINILIGTQMILKDPPLPRLTLIAMIDADSLLVFPDFQADEKLFQSLSRAVRQVAYHKNKEEHCGKVLVQTFRPESAFFQKVITLGSRDFFKQILQERKELFYPPYSRFLSLSCREKTEKLVKKNTAQLFSALKEILPSTYRINQPQPEHFIKKKNVFESSLLIRFPYQEVLSEAFKKFLVQTHHTISIDVDPLSPR